MKRLKVSPDRPDASVLAAGRGRDSGWRPRCVPDRHGVRLGRGSPRSETRSTRLFDVERTDRGMAVPLIAADIEQASRCWRRSAPARCGWPRRSGPGHSSIVAPAAPVRRAPQRGGRDDRGDPGAGARCRARHWRARSGFAVTATSANPSGDAAAESGGRSRRNPSRRRRRARRRTFAGRRRRRRSSRSQNTARPRARRRSGVGPRDKIAAVTASLGLAIDLARSATSARRWSDSSAAARVTSIPNIRSTNSQGSRQRLARRSCCA